MEVARRLQRVGVPEARGGVVDLEARAPALRAVHRDIHVPEELRAGAAVLRRERDVAS